MRGNRGRDRTGSSLLTQDTHQQTILLREMMCARSKLEEENQHLRDQLQDADMLIHLLHLKLEEATGCENLNEATEESKKTKKSASSAFPSSTALIMGWRQNKKPPTRKRDTFKNAFPPGKRTFEPPPQPVVSKRNECAVMLASETRRTSAKGIGRSEILQNGSTRTVSVKQNEETDGTCIESFQHVPNAAPSEYTYESAESVNEESVDSVVTEEAVKVSRRGATFQDREVLTEDGPKMRSVIGMLAQSVINEYSTEACC